MGKPKPIANAYPSNFLIRFRLLKSKCHSTNRRTSAKHSALSLLILNKSSTNCWRRRNRRSLAKKLMLRRPHQSRIMYRDNSVLVAHVVALAADKFVVSQIRDKRMHCLMWCNGFFLPSNSFILGGFGGPKGWNQNYGYGQGSGYYGSNYDGSSSKCQKPPNAPIDYQY